MLGLYLYTLIIGQKSCNMLSILNKLTLQKELQNFVTNNVLLGQKVKTHKKQHQKPKHKHKTIAKHLTMLVPYSRLQYLVL